MKPRFRSSKRIGLQIELLETRCLLSAVTGTFPFAAMEPELPDESSVAPFEAEEQTAVATSVQEPVEATAHAINESSLVLDESPEFATAPAADSSADESVEFGTSSKGTKSEFHSALSFHLLTDLWESTLVNATLDDASPPLMAISRDASVSLEDAESSSDESGADSETASEGDAEASEA